MKKEESLTKEDIKKIRKELEDKTDEKFKEFDIQKRKTLEASQTILFD